MSSRRSRRRRKRKPAGIILRLIDVVLILLFGFIAISEVGRKSQIKLARSETVPATAPDRELVKYVGILPDGDFLVDAESRKLGSLQAVQGWISATQARLAGKNQRLKIRVRANHDAEVRHAFAVVNFCQAQNIPVGLDVVRVGR